MDVEIVRQYCLNKKGVTEGFPFNETTLVFKVMKKMFALVSLEFPQFINLKCDPAYAIELREKYDEITPGYHMNKQHWNSVDLIGTLRDKMIYELIDQSYLLICDSLPKKVKVELGKL